MLDAVGAGGSALITVSVEVELEVALEAGGVSTGGVDTGAGKIEGLEVEAAGKEAGFLLFEAIIGLAASARLRLVDAAASTSAGVWAGELLASCPRCRGSMPHRKKTPSKRSMYPAKKNFIENMTRAYRCAYGQRVA